MNEQDLVEAAIKELVVDNPDLIIHTLAVWSRSMQAKFNQHTAHCFADLYLGEHLRSELTKIMARLRNTIPDEIESLRKY